MCNKSACAAAVVILRIWIGFRCEKGAKRGAEQKNQGVNMLNRKFVITFVFWMRSQRRFSPVSASKYEETAPRCRPFPDNR